MTLIRQTDPQSRSTEFQSKTQSRRSPVRDCIYRRREKGTRIYGRKDVNEKCHHYRVYTDFPCPYGGAIINVATNVRHLLTGSDTDKDGKIKSTTWKTMIRGATIAHAFRRLNPAAATGKKFRRFRTTSRKAELAADQNSGRVQGADQKSGRHLLGGRVSKLWQ
jgi:hypothetical protein